MAIQKPLSHTRVNRLVNPNIIGPVRPSGLSVSTAWSTGSGMSYYVPPNSANPANSPVNRMLLTTGATWAHRGGSDHWPEMTKFAYDQSIARGYEALEFSTHRTMDGWWVGVHDDSLDRTSLTTGLSPISSLTRNQVESYAVMVGQGAPRPYYGLEDFLNDYKDYVLIVDPKISPSFTSYMTGFFDLLDMYGGPSNIIAKFHGSSSIFPVMARDRGYTSWGYFYPQDLGPGGLLETRQAGWDILGFTYNAALSDWTEVLSYGKQVVAHVVPTQAGYDLAMSRGASMVQCSGVDNITAVGGWLD